VSRDLYFAYGSNLYPARLGARVPSARVVGTGYIADRRLAFHKVGMDGSAKCDAPRGRGRVHGALYTLDEGDWPLLDAAEGRGAGYERETVDVCEGDELVRASVYLAQAGHIDPGLLPFDWYLRLVVEGAVHHRFPPAYIEALAGVATQRDPDEDRAGEMWAMIEEWGCRSW